MLNDDNGIAIMIPVGETNADLHDAQNALVLKEALFFGTTVLLVFHQYQPFSVIRELLFASLTVQACAVLTARSQMFWYFFAQAFLKHIRQLHRRSASICDGTSNGWLGKTSPH